MLTTSIVITLLVTGSVTLLLTGALAAITRGKNMPLWALVLFGAFIAFMVGFPCFFVTIFSVAIYTTPGLLPPG